MKIGIVGSGISGLTAAHFLAESHQVDVFEANDYLGGHTNTIDVSLEGREYSIDTGFIVFNDRTYPGFIELIQRLKISSQPTSMTFSVRNEQLGLEYRGADLNGLFAQRLNIASPRHWWLLREMLRFNRQAIKRLEGQPDGLTVNEFFTENRYSKHFLDNFFYPMASAIWSCPASTIGQFPIRFIVEFYGNHGLLSIADRPQWKVIVGGSKQYIEPLIAPYANRVHLNTPIAAIRRCEDRVDLKTSQGDWLSFDQIIFACHSDQALKILGDQATGIEREILRQFPYEKNVAWLHTDESVLPKNRRAWAAWNYYLSGRPTEKATVTYNMNILQGITSPHTFCVSLNSQHQIDESMLLREIEYHHPVFTSQRKKYQQRHHELINHQRVSFCGAYWGNGFHEDGVQSALRVCQQLDGRTCTVASTKAGFDTEDLPQLSTN